MIKEYVAVIDSGVGGLAVLKELTLHIKNENFLYYGDNFNAPYGSKSDEELKFRMENVLNIIEKYPLKAIVIACNTLSLTVFSEVKRRVHVPVFGVFPPVEKCLSLGYKTLLLATPRTCGFFAPKKNFTAIALPNLAKSVEENLNDLNKIDLSRHIALKNDKYDAVILGCTHYELIKNQISNHLKPQFIFSGTKNTVIDVINFCKPLLKTKSQVNNKENTPLFVGKTRKVNEKFWKRVVNL